MRLHLLQGIVVDIQFERWGIPGAPAARIMTAVDHVRGESGYQDVSQLNQTNFTSVKLRHLADSQTCAEHCDGSVGYSAAPQPDGKY